MAAVLPLGHAHSARPSLAGTQAADPAFSRWASALMGGGWRKGRSRREGPTADPDGCSRISAAGTETTPCVRGIQTTGTDWAASRQDCLRQLGLPARLPAHVRRRHGYLNGRDTRRSWSGAARQLGLRAWLAGLVRHRHGYLDGRRARRS
nr:uncharacterized protein LOC120965185 [Aegilops tauschii subsp. strangulata]